MMRRRSTTALVVSRRALQVMPQRPLLRPVVGIRAANVDVRAARTGKVLLIAFVLAATAHVAFARASLGLHPKRVAQQTVTMAVIPPPPEAEPVVDETPPPPPPDASTTPPPSTASSSRSAGPSTPTFGLSAASVAGQGGGGPSFAVGGAATVGAGPSHSSEVAAIEHPATPIVRTAPRFPPAAQRAGISGFVVLRIRVAADGGVVAVEVVRAEPAGVFDDAAVAAARHYRFSPAKKGEVAVESVVQQTIRFAAEAS